MEKLKKFGPKLLAFSSIVGGVAFILAGDYAGGLAAIVAGLGGLGVHLPSVQHPPE